jgi:hypothetical protein
MRKVMPNTFRVDRLTSSIVKTVCMALCFGLSACEAKVVTEGKDAIKLQLRDPKSAEFRRIFVSYRAEGVEAACGEVNSNNATGGKTGFKRFAADGRVFAILEGDNDTDFNEVWVRFCAPLGLGQ